MHLLPNAVENKSRTRPMSLTVKNLAVAVFYVSYSLYSGITGFLPSSCPSSSKNTRRSEREIEKGEREREREKDDNEQGVGLMVWGVGCRVCLG